MLMAAPETEKHQAKLLAITQGTLAESSTCPLFSFSRDSRYNPKRKSYLTKYFYET